MRLEAIRIQPASFFARPDHNGAVRDDELTLNMAVALTRDDVIKLVKEGHKMYRQTLQSSESM